MPYVRTFLRVLTGCSRINSTVARRIPGLHRDPKELLNNLKQVEEVLDALIASQGKCCPLPLSTDVQGVRLENGNYPTLRLFFVQSGIDCT